MAAIKKYKIGQAVSDNGNFVFVKRDNDHELIHNIMADGESIAIVGARQMGKTTLAASVQKKLIGEGFFCGYIDLSNLSSTFFSGQSEETKMLCFFEKFLNDCMLAFQLNNLDNNKFALWFSKNSKESISVALITSFFCEFILKENRRICLFLDEFQTIYNHSHYRDYLLSAIRVLQNDVFSRQSCSIAFIGIIEPYEIFSKESSISLNTYRSKYINDFQSDDQTINELASGLANLPNTQHKDIVKQIMKYTGGQPFLTVLLLRLWKEKKDIYNFNVFIRNIIEKMIQGEVAKSHFHQPVKYFENYDREVIKSLNAYKLLLNVESMALDSKIATSLRLAGLIKGAGRGLWKIKNQIYKKVLDHKWANDTLNDILSKYTAKPNLTEPGSHKKKCICLINMGGTIAMGPQKDKKTGQIKVVHPDDSETFFRTYYPEIWDIADINFERFDPPKDGANVTPKDWSEIADIISRKKLHGFDGFVITHGTDTIVYTASALAFALGRGLNFPVVFTGAQTTHDVWYGDAHINLLRAIKVAGEKIPEVVICFNDLILRACRAQKKHDQKFDGFESPSFRPLGYITEKIEIQKELLISGGIVELKNDFDPRVIELVQYPGLSPDILMEILDTGQIRGFIIRTLGVGNLTNTDKYSLIPFIEEATKRLMPVIITSQFPIEPEVALKYAPASAPIQAGAIPAGNMTPAAALTKLMWTLPQIDTLIQKGDYKKDNFIELVKEKMQEDFVGEVDKIIIT